MAGQEVILVNRGLVRDPKGKILIIQRAKDDSWGANLWELPGGKLDKGQSIDGALEREVLEETGLFVRRTSPNVFLENEIVTEGKYKGKTYITLVGEAELIGGKLKLSKEHQKHKWATENKVFDYKLTTNSHKALATFIKSK